MHVSDPQTKCIVKKKKKKKKKQKRKLLSNCLSTQKNRGDRVPKTEEVDVNH